MTDVVSEKGRQETMYTARQKQMRQCKKVKKDGGGCKAYSKVGGDFCALHTSFDPKAPRPKKGVEREVAKHRRDKKRLGKQARAVCLCPAFPHPHRLSSGRCRFPDPPALEVEDSGFDYPEYDLEPEPTTAIELEQSDFDYFPELESEEVPADREERERWNARKLKRLIENASNEETTPQEALMSRVWRGEFNRQ